MTATGLRSRLDPVIATTAAEIDRWSVQKDAGYRTVAQLFSDKTSDNPKQTRTDARIRRWIDDFPKFTQAWTAGDITTSHLEHIRRSVHNSRTRAALITDQAKFITWATDFDFIDFIDFEHICIYWKNAVDPDSAEPKEQTTKNYFRAQEQGDSSGKLDGHLDPLMFAAYKTAFNFEDEKLFHQNHDNAVFNNAVFNNAVFGDAVFGDAEHVPDLTTGQRGAHALMNLVVKGAARPDGSQPEPLITPNPSSPQTPHHPKPLITVVASQHVIEDTSTGCDAPSNQTLPLAFDDIDKRCELADGTPLHPSYLLAILGVATFRRQILTATSRTIDVSLNTRCFTPWQKHALIVEARGRCTSTGCDAPFAWLQADHTHPHSRGGPTRLHNGKMKCGPDNQAKGNRTAA